ncbi:hypothetical protein [Phenylobacterium sp.]|uniref:hypothetical protein n=1 Tax=Phenylobacterium sp. TaxID=1871053 RepID=UPI0027280E31|nr:hypothetical protein [Phenylobacterium sp.]MDO8379278.1 hypothetical protein [Phenylobacterium sp.]
MLGIQILLISFMGFLAGLEASAPGAVGAVLTATAQVSMAVQDGTYQKLHNHVELLRDSPGPV